MNMVRFESSDQLLYGLFVMAIIPGVAEELIFRGLIQRLLITKNYNPHVVIWCVAALFSAIHFQFLGFLPRMLLGGVFGYIYWWSGSMTFPMVAHVLNNGFTLLMMHSLRISTLGTPDYDELDQSNFLTIVLLTAVFALVLFMFRKICVTHQIEPMDEANDLRIES